jgi:hypothetical protein
LLTVYYSYDWARVRQAVQTLACIVRGVCDDFRGTETIPASGNGSLAPLSNNTWGYNIDGSTNYLGMTTTPTLLKTATGPYESGDNTTVKYGVLTDFSKSSGVYTATVTYTAVALTD